MKEAQGRGCHREEWLPICLWHLGRHHEGVDTLLHECGLQRLLDVEVFCYRNRDSLHQDPLLIVSKWFLNHLKQLHSLLR